MGQLFKETMLNLSLFHQFLLNYCLKKGLLLSLEKYLKTKFILSSLEGLIFKKIIKDQLMRKL